MQDDMIGQLLFIDQELRVQLKAGFHSDSLNLSVIEK